ncbi:MAG: GDSL-type esterase/lipase family protein [Patescibacteria group bacterium]
MHKFLRKYWKWAIAVLVVILVAYFVVVESQKITNQDSENVGVVAFGDSLVAGVGSVQGGGFVKTLSADLDLPITNLGRSGDTTALALARVGEVALMKPALTIVLLGGNDYLQGVPESETKANLGKIIEALHASGSAVVLVGIESGVPGTRHRAIFETLSEEYKTAYVPNILDGIYGHQEFMSDNLHPNDKGYRFMAERIKSTLASI